MKIIGNTWLLLLLTVFGCDRQFYGDEQESPIRQYEVSLNIESPLCRSLSGIASETWEKKINTASIYIFDSNRKSIFIKKLNATEISGINTGTSPNITFSLPTKINTCDIYVVANTIPSASVTTKAAFLTSIEQDIASYNGTFAATTTSALRPNGFVMTGNQPNVSLNATGTTSISIPLKRIVAKLALEVNISALITLGTSTVTTVTINQSAPVSNLFPFSPLNTTGTAIQLSQTAQVTTGNTRQFKAFFYIYENGTRTPASNQIKITFLIVNTVPIIGSTTYTYNVSVTGSGSGQINRNNGYYVIADVNKLINILLSVPFRNTSEAISIEEKIIY